MKFFGNSLPLRSLFMSDLERTCLILRRFLFSCSQYATSKDLVLHFNERFVEFPNCSIVRFVLIIAHKLVE